MNHRTVEPAVLPRTTRPRRAHGYWLAASLAIGAGAAAGPWELSSAQAAPAPASSEAAETSDEQLAAARSLFREGLDLEKKSDWEEALATFEKVAAVKLTPQVRYHIALCHDNLGQLIEALNGYELAAHEAKLAGKAGLDVADNAPARIAAIRARVGHLRVSVVGKVRTSKILLDGRPIALALLDSDIPLNPGDHVVQVEQGGETVTRQPVRIEKGKTIDLELEIDDAEPPPETPASSGTSSPTAPPPAPSDESSQVPAYIVGAAGLLLVAGGAVFWGLRESTIAEIRETCGANDERCDPDLQERADLGETYTLLGRIFFPVGGAALATGVVLWFVLAPDEDPSPTASAAVHVVPTLGGVQLFGRF
jgi:tetratricopeptide (TPR) repeat protein